MKYRFIPFLFTLVFLSAPAFAADGKFSLATGVHYSSGDYGEDTDTDMWYVPIIAQYQKDRWRFKLTVPWLQIKGPGNVLPDVGEVSNGLPDQATENGLGDIIAEVRYRAYENNSSGFYLYLTGKVKFGTADEDKNLGTGENDYAVQVNATKVIDRYAIFGHLGYKVYGDTSDTDFNDVFYGSIGGQYEITDPTAVGLLASYKQATTNTNQPQRSVTAFVTHQLDKTWKLQGYVIRGFSDSNPDWSVGFLVRHTFGQ
jgi:hypothetical protein